ncbi:MAG: hypothetical protein ACK5CE_14250 [Actinomycetes bacterium]
MNRALLAELQGMTCYPSVTILHTTQAGDVMDPDDVTALLHLVDQVDRRLDGDVPDEQRADLVARLLGMIAAAATERSTRAIAICASPIHQAVVRLGREVRGRAVIDDTFATRDMVADANRTATFRLVTVSDRKARALLGDRSRVVEERDRTWPLLREEDQSLAQWSRAVSHAVRTMQRDFPLPTVVAGVDRSVRELMKLEDLRPIGTIPGNHDRTGWRDLHHLAWPLVVDWLRGDSDRARRSLEAARDTHRYAGGIDEVWELAQDGRVELLVVEEDYELAARLRDGRLERAADAWAPDVIDDAVDELIETVLRKGGEAVLFPPGELAHLDRVGAVLRY